MIFRAASALAAPVALVAASSAPAATDRVPRRADARLPAGGDRGRPLNGIPLVHPRYTGEGTVTNTGPIQEGAVATIDPDSLAGPMRHSMPLNNQVVDFGP